MAISQTEPQALKCFWRKSNVAREYKYLQNTRVTQEYVCYLIEQDKALKFVIRAERLPEISAKTTFLLS